MKKLLAIDPSGSFNSGNGVTGYSVFELETKKIIEVGNIKAKNFNHKDDYFYQHLNLISSINPTKIIIEAFVLYKDTASSFFHQELETSELIGEITGYARVSGITLIKQRAREIKGPLYKPNVLLKAIDNQIEHKKTKADRNQWYFKGIRISNHIVDSIRHAAYYFNKEKKSEKDNE